jgi:hypothetical protein
MATTNPNVDALLSASAGNVITATSSQAVLILKATVSNNDNVIHNVSVWRVSNTGAPSNLNRLINAQPVPPGGTITLNLTGQTLIGGQSFQAAADLSGVVTFNCSYQLTQ